MRSLSAAFLLFSTLLFAGSANAQSPNIAIATKEWNAYWIVAPNSPGTGYGVYHFRKSINLATKPVTFNIRISADNRYKLYVNGILVSLGPARGDTYYWNYETVDIAPYLTTGKNTIAATVWNDGPDRPEAQISLRTAFIVQGDSPAEEIANTDTSWKCIRDTAYTPNTWIGYYTYYVAGPGEIIDMKHTVKGFTDINFDDTKWPEAEELDHGKPKGMSDAFGWMLVPSQIPQMERTLQRIPVLRKADGMTIAASFPATKTAITIPANTTVTLLLDQTYLTSAYVTFNFSKGKDAGIAISYAESLFDSPKDYDKQKSNRNDIQGKYFAGRKDSLISDGTDGQTFNSLYWRTYRYVQVRVQTKNDPLTIDDIYGTFTGYPFKYNAVFNTDNEEIKKILEIGWRTCRLDAMETYMDCPYYEQLQYIGDTRIQAMVSYYNSGDDRLARNAINLMDHSRIAEGLTLSRHPSFSPQIISTFSLWYIGMLHDYWMYRADSNFVKSKLMAERSILDFFSKYQQADGSLKSTPYWTFIDWADGKNWHSGMPPTGSKGNSSMLDMQLLWAYQQAAEMEGKMGMAAYAVLYAKKAAQLKQTIENKYWDAAKTLYADTEDKNLFSQHANSLAILTGLVKPQYMATMAKNMLNDTSLTQCTIYFKYYMHQALVKAGLGNDYLSWLDVWRNNIKMGLTTWAEISDLKNNRSDCHAWGSSPNIEFYRTVLGIDSYAPGFSKIKIEPHLGALTNVSGEIPHPNGKVAVAYVLDKDKWKISITLPQNTSGVLVWKTKKYLLKAGQNSFTI
jgi:alpha-L-rhamnosidase